MTRREQEPAGAELEVLRALWDMGPAPVRGVMDWLHQRGRPVAYTTVQTLLNRLENKRLVRANKSGQAFVYRATISREQVTGSRLRKLLDQLYDGAAGPLVLQLLRTQPIRPEELDELQRLIDRLDSKEQP